MSTVTMPVGVRPCADPEHDLYPPDRNSRWERLKRYSGVSVGMPGVLICPQCHRRRYKRFVRAGTPARVWLTKQKAEALSPYVGRPVVVRSTIDPPGPPPEPPREIDLMDPAEVSLLVRRVWGSPQAGVILTARRVRMDRVGVGCFADDPEFDYDPDLDD